MDCLFLRHGIAVEWTDWHDDDQSRPLTNAGIHKTRKATGTLLFGQPVRGLSFNTAGACCIRFEGKPQGRSGTIQWIMEKWLRSIRKTHRLKVQDRHQLFDQLGGSKQCIDFVFLARLTSDDRPTGLFNQDLRGHGIPGTECRIDHGPD